MWREPEHSIIPVARELEVGIVPYSPLGRGLLGGRLDATSVSESPFRANDPRFVDANLSANMQQVDALTTFAESRGMTVSQVALAWLLAQGDDVVPIPGTRKPERVRENAEAMRCQLSADDLVALEKAVPESEWVGDRRSFAVPVTKRG